MGEPLSFEAKIQGLIDYYHAVDQIDPVNSNHCELANPNIFYWSLNTAGSSLARLKRCLLDDIEYHAHEEYIRRGLNIRDLREDTDSLRIERADMLAVLTAPTEEFEREERTEQISTVLAGLVTGKTLRIINYDSNRRQYDKPIEVTADTNYPLFGVLGSHIFDRTWTAEQSIQELRVSAVKIDFPAMFSSENNLQLSVAA